MKRYVFGSLVLIGLFSICAFGQTEVKESRFDRRLPATPKQINCEIVLRYLDEAMAEAHSNNSNLILIIDMKKSDLKMAEARVNNLYINLRVFQNYKFGINFDSKESEKLELFVLGESLYSLPVKSKDKLDLTECVVGPEI